MPETYQSEDSEDMNAILTERLKATASYLFKKRNKLSRVERLDIKNQTVQEIYNILVKFLGEPPKEFTWFYTDEEGHSSGVSNLTPRSFKNVILGGLNLEDFVVLSHIPSVKYQERYQVNNTTNVEGGEPCTVLNLPLSELKKYAKKSVLAGLPVWFVGDVMQDFGYTHSVLHDNILDKDTAFGKMRKFSKEERIKFRNVMGTHAMAFVGVNITEKGKPLTWQVENSWGYWDYETPGLDGFLSMNDGWFDKYVTQIVVHKEFLTRSIQKLLNKEPIIIEPWDAMAPALRVTPVNPPKNYLGRKN
jgi:bleomycin hydrolase